MTMSRGVIHGADYRRGVYSETWQAGRSLGCPSVSNDVSDELISAIKRVRYCFCMLQMRIGSIGLHIYNK